jgi:ribosomal protein S27AE
MENKKRKCPSCNTTEYKEHTQFKCAKCGYEENGEEQN